MKYTKEQLQAMSDFEVNKALAVLCGLKVSDKQYFEYSDRDERIVLIDGLNIGDASVDYCNNPNDIMPLTLEYGLSLNKSSNFKESEYGVLSWTASEGVHGYIDYDCYPTGHYFVDTKPLRAIACCLILVLQDKQDE